MIGWIRHLIASGPQIGPAAAVARLNAGAVLVDVREPGEFVSGHVRGALHVPLGRIRAQGVAAIDALLPRDTTEVLLVCLSGMRSRLAQSVLTRDTRRAYLNVQGGMAAWTAGGLPLVHGKP